MPNQAQFIDGRLDTGSWVNRWKVCCPMGHPSYPEFRGIPLAQSVVCPDCGCYFQVEMPESERLKADGPKVPNVITT